MPWSLVEKEVRNRDTCEAKCLVLEKQLFGLNAAVFSLLSRVVPFSYRDLIYSLNHKRRAIESRLSPPDWEFRIFN